jgi:hypothetical protein
LVRCTEKNLATLGPTPVKLALQQILFGALFFKRNFSSNS